MHHVYANKTHGEIPKSELHKNATCCFEHILEAAPHKQHLYDQQDTRDTVGESKINSQVKFFFGTRHKLCADTGCCLEGPAWSDG